MLPEMERSQIQSQNQSHGYRYSKCSIQRNYILDGNSQEMYQKVPIRENNTQSNHIPIPVSDQADQLPSTEVAFSHSVLSMEGVFCHSDTSVEGNLPCHSVLPTEGGSQMNCSSISETADL